MIENDNTTVGAIVMFAGIGILVFIYLYSNMPPKIKKWLMALCLSLFGVILITPNAEYKPGSFYMDRESLIAFSFILFIAIIFATIDRDKQTKEQEKTNLQNVFDFQAVKPYPTLEQNAAHRRKNN